MRETEREEKWRDIVRKRRLGERKIKLMWLYMIKRMKMLERLRERERETEEERKKEIVSVCECLWWRQREKRERESEAGRYGLQKNVYKLSMMGG